MSCKPLTYRLTIILCLIYGSGLCQKADTIKTATYKIGKCRASVAGVRSGKISRRKLLNAKKLDVEWCEDSSRVSYFDLVVQYSTVGSYALTEKPMTKEAKANNELFTNEMLNYIRKAPKGSTVSITHIKYRLVSGEEQKLETDILLIIQ